jgi:hypothetical protein
MKFKVNLDIPSHMKEQSKVINTALIKIGQEIVNDTDFGTNAPKIPIREGYLVGSAHIMTEKHQEWVNGKASDTIEPIMTGLQKDSLRVSYNTSYAEEIHESYNKMPVGRFSMKKFGLTSNAPQSKYGWKFLSRTVAINSKKYEKLFKEFLSDFLK